MSLSICSFVKWSLSPGWSISQVRWFVSCWTMWITWPYAPSWRPQWWNSSSGPTSVGSKVNEMEHGTSTVGRQLQPHVCSSSSSPESTRCLQHLCRLRIRRCLGLLRLRSPIFMSFLPLPGRLKDYVLYREYDMYSQKSGSPGWWRNEETKLNKAIESHWFNISDPKKAF